MPNDATDQPGRPWVGVIMGSKSDLAFMQPAIDLLVELAVPYEAKVVSAHRTPDWAFEYASTAESRGIEVIIAAAGGAAHLPGIVAAKTLLPVLGVPVMQQLRGWIRGCPEPAVIADGGHFLQEWGDEVMDRWKK